MQAAIGYRPAIRTTRASIHTAPDIGPTKNSMTTLVEKDSATPAILLIFAVVFLLLGGGLAFVYLNGVFGERTAVVEDYRTVENKTVVVPAEEPAFVPAREPDSAKPEQTPAH
jgi:hypothetical protein